MDEQLELSRVSVGDLDIDNDAIVDVHPERLEMLLDRRRQWLDRGVRSWWVRYPAGILVSLILGIAVLLTWGAAAVIGSFVLLMVALGFGFVWYTTWADQMRALSRGALHWCAVVPRTDNLDDGVCENPRGERLLHWAHLRPMHDGSGRVAVLLVGESWTFVTPALLRRALGVPEPELGVLTEGMQDLGPSWG